MGQNLNVIRSCAFNFEVPNFEVLNSRFLMGACRPYLKNCRHFPPAGCVRGRGTRSAAISACLLAAGGVVFCRKRVFPRRLAKMLTPSEISRVLNPRPKSSICRFL